MPRHLFVSALALGLAVSVHAQSSALSPFAEQAAIDYIRAQAPVMGLSAADVSDLVVVDGHRSGLSGLNYAYVQQHHNGIPVADALATVAVDSRGRVVHATGSMVPELSSSATRSANSLTASQAVQIAASAVGAPGTPSTPISTGGGASQFTRFGQVAGVDVTARLVYTPNTRSGAALAWETQIPTADAHHVWVVRVDAGNGAELARYDLVVSDHWGPAEGSETAEAAAPSLAPFVEAVPAPSLEGSSMVGSYLVYPVPYESPIHSPTVPPADGRTTEVNPDDATASPFGWHDTDGVAGNEYTITWGNNVRAYQDRANDNTGTAADSPDCGAAINCSFPLDLTLDPVNYTAAATANLFYWNNIIHDVKYHYGFDEAAGNFQVNNYGNGGAGNDDVRAEAQDGGGTNNANMFTPADGSQPRMQMYEWTTATPRLDGDFDAGIIIHEYTHGTSNRLTGGPGNVGCLNNSEQMGEGWSDWYGLMLTQQVGDTGPQRRGIGTYALNQPTTGVGIRPAPYSTSFAENSFTYGDLPGQAIPHGVGFVWSTILWEMTWELIDAHGYDPDVYNASGTAGNQIALALVTEGMKLQPCSPGFVDGRDAILAADQALYGGANTDLLWAAFARRGLGFSADQGSSGSTSDGTEAFDTPIAPGSLSISPSSLTFNVTPGGTASADVTITNNGAPGDGDGVFDAAITRFDQPPGAAFGTGGPDAFGYAWIDSDEPGGPAVDFQDISGTGTAVTWTGTGTFDPADEGVATLTLPFTFNFYGVDYTEIIVNTNGYLTFGPTTGNSWTNPSAFPGTSSPTNINNVVAPFWDDLDQSAGGTTYYDTLPDGRFVVQYDGVPRYFDTGSSLTFQAIFSDDGTIEFQYGTLTTGTLNSNSIGLENADASIGLEVAANETYIKSDHAVLFYSPVIWVSVAPASGTVDEGTSEDVTVSVDAAELPAGIYTADLTIETNDSSLPSTIIPITLTVGDDGTTSIVIDGDRGVRYLGPPAPGITIDDLADQNLVRGVPGYYPGAAPNLWTEYDPVAGAWNPSTGTGEELDLGYAFRWYFLNSDGPGDPNISVSVALPFTLTTTEPENTSDVVVQLSTDGNRFNHLANPFGTDLDLSGYASWIGAPGIRSGLFVYNDVTSSWEPAPASIGPWEAFRFRAKGPRRNGNPRLLQIPASASIPLSEAAREAGPAVEAESGLTFRLEGRDETGRAIADGMLGFTFDDEATAAFSIEEDDVEKFQAPATRYAMLGARVGGTFAGHDARPFAAAEIPLAFDARGAASEFTLRWDADRLPAGLPVTLVDLATGEEVDVRTTSSYTFRAASKPALEEIPTGDLADGSEAADRFVLRIGEGLASAEAEVTELALAAPAPNPSAGTARVGFALPEAGFVRLAVYDVRGREVAVLAEGEMAAGRHEATLASNALAAGVYVVRYEAMGRVLTQRATVVR